MGNHYDPYEERDAEIAKQRRETGTAMKTKVLHTPSEEMVSEYASITGRMRAVEEHIIGGQHVDNLRQARKELARLFGISP